MTLKAKIHHWRLLQSSFTLSDVNRLSRLSVQLFFHKPNAYFAIKESRLNTLINSTEWHFTSSTLNEYADKWSDNGRLEKCDPIWHCFAIYTLHALGTVFVLFTQYYKVYTQVRTRLAGHAGRTLREKMHTSFGSVKQTEIDHLDEIGLYEKMIINSTWNVNDINTN